MTTKFSTDLQVRPDDIDMFQHVHNSKYLDYVQTARFEQMVHCYKVSMQEFMEMGFGWVVKKATINFKRPLGLGDSMIVSTQVLEIDGTDAIIDFEIRNKKTEKISCDGQMIYTLINLKTARSEIIPENIREKYLI
jgi:YbgC/YbaW family acyl-CoA thioester hydrolase